MGEKYKSGQRCRSEGCPVQSILQLVNRTLVGKRQRGTSKRATHGFAANHSSGGALDKSYLGAFGGQVLSNIVTRATRANNDCILSLGDARIRELARVHTYSQERCLMKQMSPGPTEGEEIHTLPGIDGTKGTSLLNVPTPVATIRCLDITVMVG